MLLQQLFAVAQKRSKVGDRVGTVDIVDACLTGQVGNQDAVAFDGAVGTIRKTAGGRHTSLKALMPAIIPS